MYTIVYKGVMLRKDMDEVEIKVGDRIGYLRHYRTSAELSISKIKNFTPKAIRLVNGDLTYGYRCVKMINQEDK